jgi:FkbH-like protein
MALPPEVIIPVFRAFHSREPTPQAVAAWQAHAPDLEALVRGLAEVKERARREAEAAASRRPPAFAEHNGPRFGAPRELQATPTPLKRVLLVGNCLLAPWPRRLRELGVETLIDHVLMGLAEPPVLSRPAQDYSFQVTAIGNRHVINDAEMLQWLRLRPEDGDRAQAMVQTFKGRIERLLEIGAATAKSIPVFVTPFLEPQQELNGRLIPGGGVLDLYAALNAHLRAGLARMSNVYLLDTVRLFNTIGRRRLQDDVINVSTHAALAGDGFVAQDALRIEPPGRPSEHYEWNVDEFLLAAWFEAEAMYRTLRQIDQVKMICVDLDDTLWRGVLAEEGDLSQIDPVNAGEGWPIGIVEALLTLKRRGVLLCLVSKNSPERVRAIFARVYRNKLSLDDFAILKIGWAPKPQSIAEAMAQAHLLPRSVVFLDDNPVERAAVQQAFPDIRVISAPLHYWRRILLWSPETQTAVLTAESARRTQMVQAQTQREEARAQSDPQTFLASLELQVEVARVGPESARFARALELVNKSNQFNTTGRRWSAQELADIAEGGGLVAAKASDKYADYGDVFVALLRGGRVEQVVMSCRVITLGVELAAMSAVARAALATHARLVAEIVETDANGLARDLYARCGWAREGATWTTQTAQAPPAHVALTSAL